MSSTNVTSTSYTPTAASIDTSSSNTGFGENMNKVGLGYGIAIAVGILVLVSTIMLASYVCVRVYGRRRFPAAATTTMSAVLSSSGAAANAAEQGGIISSEGVICTGLDQATLDTYPKIVYAGKQSLLTSHRHDPSCSICLADYRLQEVLRLLPECSHVFHASCIDAWLRLQPSCPMCRTSPLPTPVSTPLSELIPLARRPLDQRHHR